MMLLDNRGFVYLLFTLWSIIRPGDGGLMETTTIKGDTRKYKVVCYHTNWSQYRQKPARFYPYNIDPNICTHIIYSFAKIDYRGQLAPLEWNDIDYPHMYRQFNNLKKKNPKLKTLLAVGGWNHGSRAFTDMVKSKESRRYFIDHSIQYLRAHKFDGLDLDWEYPANRGSPPEDKKRFVSLVRDLRKAFELEGTKTKRERLLLSAAVGCGFKIIDSAYDVKGMSSHFDFINLMTYDLHGSWEKALGINAPLYPRKEEIDKPAGKLNVDWVVKRFIELGAPPDKLIMGIPLYGRSFKLCGNDVKPGSRACGAGKAGPFTKEKGFMAYYEIVRGFQDGWVREWDSEHMTPYAYSSREKQWVGYDDMESIYHKAMYVKSHTLGGVMVWALDLDDFANIATEGMNYPLIRTISDVLWDDFLLPPSAVPEQISTLGTIKSSINMTQIEIRTIPTKPTRLRTLTTSTQRSMETDPTTTTPATRRVTSRRNPYTPPKPKATRRIPHFTLPSKTSLILPEGTTQIKTTKHIPRYTIPTTKKPRLEITTNLTQSTSYVTPTPVLIERITVRVPHTKTTKVTTIHAPSRVTLAGNNTTKTRVKVKPIGTWKTTTPVHRTITSRQMTTSKVTINSSTTTATKHPSRQSTTSSRRTTSPPRTKYTSPRTVTMPTTRHSVNVTTTRYPGRTTWKWWFRTSAWKTKSPRKSTTKPRQKSTTARPTTRKWRRKTTNLPPRRPLATVRYRNSTGDYKIQNEKKPGQKTESTTPCIIVQVQEKVEHSRFPETRPIKTTRNPYSVQQTMTDFICPTIFGIYSDPEDCTRFYQCVWFVPFHYSCGPGTAWNDPLKVCDWPDRVHCSR